MNGPVRADRSQGGSLSPAAPAGAGVGAGSGARGETDALLAAFAGEIQPARLSGFYRLGLAVVAGAMVLLPAAYAALIGVVGWLVYLHASRNVWILNGHASTVAKAIGYFGPIAIGATVLVFMVKPFFAKGVKRTAVYSLNPEDEPLLFAFIHRICQLVNAPPPTRVDVDCQVNASASYRRGWRSLLGGDVVLTIGLPLVAGLSRREFAGVLGHEFGHFAQGAGMRMTYLIRHVNHWFARVVYERDAWDVSLEEASKSMDLRLGVVLYATRGCVWLSRRILWVLMVVGNAISCFMLRQMEYDADTYEMKVAGSDTFTGTFHHLQALNVAAGAAYAHMRESWRNQRLPDNVPAFILSRAQALPAEVRRELNQAASQRKTRLFDTHPADADRIRAGEAAAEPGVFRQAGPAASLFRDFEALSRAVTRFHYEQDLGLTISDHNLVPTGESAGEAKALTDAMTHLAQHLPAIDPARRWAPPGPSSPVSNGTSTTDLRGLQEQHAALVAQGAAMREVLVRCGQAEDQVVNARQALALLEAGFRVKPKDFGLKTGNQEEAVAVLRSALADLAAGGARLGPHEAAAGAWLTAGVERFRASTPRTEADAAEREAAGQLLEIWRALDACWGPMRDLRYLFAELNVLLANCTSERPNEALNQAINARMKHLNELLGKILPVLERLPYPFPHAAGPITLRRFVQPDLPPANDLEAVYRQSATLIELLSTFHARLLGQLAQWAVRAQESAAASPGDG